MKSAFKEVLSPHEHTIACKTETVADLHSPAGKLCLGFTDRKQRFTLTLDVGLFALLDCIACAEAMPLASLVVMIRRGRDPAQSLPVAACNFIGKYYYLKAHAPMGEALTLAFGPSPLRLAKRPCRLSRPLLAAWRAKTGLHAIEGVQQDH